MAAPSSPFAFLEDLIGRVGERLQPPAWAVHEVQHRLVLFLNHVLQQEPEAQDRLARQKGRVALFQWRGFTLRLQATPAGLLDLAPEAAAPDLTLTVTENSPFALAGATLRGDKPPVQIEGDVQLAAEVNWLADHVRWDVEDDLARVVGDAPAHAIGNAARKVGGALRQFIDKAATVKPASRPE
ncbi:SCP2 domain-containing protein [Xenophilus sp. Marseille-Q4582]|uniref:ubiquinone biosynthesis accessory factor UbiJ n=1 Tax=Xenophilus sp. Marseille-Q4582 TaxID=2866600 RepID=UPI001CE40153|nr:SCP2 sterol-binding domain-containing protein [Xenophilus sp. Marseille-Q4582]